MSSEGKAGGGGLLSYMWRHGSSETLWGNILKEDTAGAGFLGQNMLGWGAFLHSQLIEGGGLINSQVQPLRAVGRQRAWAPPGGVGGNGRAGLPPSVSWHTPPWLWDRGTRIYRQTGVRKDPRKVSMAGYRMSVGMSWKGWWGRQERSLFSVWGLRAASWMWEWGTVWEGLEQEGELCKQKHGNLIRTDIKSWWCRRQRSGMWGWNMLRSIAWSLWHDETETGHLNPFAFYRWQNPLSVHRV